MNRTIDHYIQRDILRSLSRSHGLSFSNLKPNGLDNGIFGYHLKQLRTAGLVEKDKELYLLSITGVRYVAEATRTNIDQHSQPKLFSFLIIRNDFGEYVLHPRNAQPFVGRYTFPGGALFFGEDLEEQTTRQLYEKIGFELPLTNRGMASLRLGEAGNLLSHSYAHLFYGEVSGQPTLTSKDSRFTPEWIKLSALGSDQLLPDVHNIVAKIQSSPEYFFLDLEIIE